MKKILYIGWCMPYDSVAHAGGQIFNYYIKEMSKEASIKLLTIALPGELEKATIEKYGVDTTYIDFSNLNLLDKVKSINSKYNPWHKYGHIVTKYKAEAFISELNEMKKDGYNPDLIVLQWTQVILMINEIKRIYPESKYVAVEEDVTFLRLRREYEAEDGIKYLYRKIIYKNEKKREMQALSKCDIVYTNNKKDQRLLISNGFEKKNLKVLVPYYYKYNVIRKNLRDNKDILFFGNMGRPENYNAAIEFIENVFPKLKTVGARFVVLGGNAEKLKKYEKKNVTITGYIKNPDEYFANSAIFVAPIKQGAGIKIKVLEAMSSGIPVITTEVGIEGIPATNEKDYLLYKNEDELVKCIDYLLNNKEMCRKIGESGKVFVRENFNFEDSIQKYKKCLLSL